MGNLRVEAVGDVEWKVDLVRGQEKPFIQGWYSPRYGRKAPATVAVFSGRVEADATFAWLLLPARGDVPRAKTASVTMDGQRAAIHVELHNGETWDLAVPEAGMYRGHFRDMLRLCDAVRETLEGPVLGEGSSHMFGAGLHDAVIAKAGRWPVADIPHFVDFAHLKLHPLCVSYGFWQLVFFLSSADFAATAESDQAKVTATGKEIASTLAYGHAGRDMLLISAGMPALATAVVAPLVYQALDRLVLRPRRMRRGLLPRTGG